MTLASIPSPRKDLSQGRWGDFLEEQVTEDMPNAEEEDELEEADSLCVGDVSSEGEEAAPEPSKAEEVSGTAETSPALEGRSGIPRQEEGGEDGANSLCAEEGGVTSEAEPSKAEEVMGTAEIAKTTPALEGKSGNPQQGALVEDGSDEGDGATAASRRRRRGRQRQRCDTRAPGLVERASGQAAGQRALVARTKPARVAVAAVRARPGLETQSLSWAKPPGAQRGSDSADGS